MGPVQSLRLGMRAFTWTGTALFAAALAYFVFSYTVTFGEIADGQISAGAVAANVALFTGFALHHSVFARLPARAWIARTCSPHVERSVYVWIASLMLILVCAMWQPVAGVAWMTRGPATWLLWTMQAAGVWLTLRSAAIIDIRELAGVRVAPPGSWTFRAEGPYAWVRHPIYLGWLLLVFPVGTMTMTRLVFALTSSAYILIAIGFEERSLQVASGGAYDGYMRQVRWKLLPGVY